MKRPDVKTIIGYLFILFGAIAPWVISTYELSLLGRFLALSILAMGDSYTAGNGAGAYYGPAGCWRSHRQFPNAVLIGA